MNSRVQNILTLIILIVTLVACSTEKSQVVDSKELSKILKQARSEYFSGNYLISAVLYEEAIRKGSKNPENAYNAACSFALADNTPKAIESLNKAIELGYRNVRWIQTDTDLANVRMDSSWVDILKRVEDNEQKYLSSINEEAYRLMQADQEDRSMDWSTLTDEENKAIFMRDRQRRERMQELIDQDVLKVSDDYYHAALVFQHGEDSTEYRIAHEMALKSAELDSSNLMARWLVAASYDRYLNSMGKPQVWGTQYYIYDGVWSNQPFDTTKITDEQRKWAGVRTLAEICEYLAEKNKGNN